VFEETTASAPPRKAAPASTTMSVVEGVSLAHTGTFATSFTTWVTTEQSFWSLPMLEPMSCRSMCGQDRFSSKPSAPSSWQARARVPVWAKLTPSTTDIVVEAGAAFRGGADAVVSSNTYPSLPLIDPETLEFEMNVDGLVSSGGLGGPAILPLSLAKMSQMTRAFPEKSFSGIGGISDFGQALNYFLLGCGTVQVCTAAMLDHAVGPNVIKRLLAGMREFLEKNAHRGFTKLEDFRGLRRDRIVAHSQIRRPDDSDYHGGHESYEGYAEPAAKA
jgi:hypothetical protein